MLLVVLLAPAATAQKRRRAATPAPLPPVIVVTDNFQLGARGWEGAFADYSPVNDVNGLMELFSGTSLLPLELGTSTLAFRMTGHNRSDDLFMFLSKKLTQADGIRPGQRYEAFYRITFASNAGGEACVGIGGHPGFSVYLKAGASGEAPRVELDATDHYRVTVDKGNQSTGGPAATVAGDISTGSANCTSGAPYQTIERQHRHTFVVQANSFGELWLLVGTDSGFEGKTTVYYQSIVVTLTPVP